MDYVFIAVDQGISQSTVPIGQVRQVIQIVAYTKPKSILPLGVSDSINSTNSPSISNKIEILSNLEEELND